MRKFLTITKALADANRVRMLLALSGQELCLCQLIELVELAPSTVSKHMSILRQADLVETRKDGRWVYYRQAGADADPMVRQALDWAHKTMANDPQIAKDARLLQQIVKLDIQVLCEQASSSPCGRSRSKAAGRQA